MLLAILLSRVFPPAPVAIFVVAGNPNAVEEPVRFLSLID